MALHFPKISIKNAVKRSCALLAALCIALYSLITAPLFGVHVVADSTLDKVFGWLEDQVEPTVFGIFDQIESGDVDPLQTVKILTANALIAIGKPLAMNASQAVLSAFDYSVPYPVSVTPSTSIGYTGYTLMNGEYKVTTINTIDPFTVTFDPQSNDFPIKFFVMSLGSYGVYAIIEPYTAGETEFLEGDTITITSTFGYYSGYDQFKYGISFLDSSGASVTRRCLYYLCFIPLSGGSPLYVSGNNRSPGFDFLTFRCYRPGSNVNVTIDDVVSYFGNNIFTAHAILGDKYNDSNGQSVRINYISSDPHYPVNPNYYSLSEDNIYNYYVNTNYPTVTTTYPIVNVIQPPQDYVVPTDPTEPNTGTTGGVIIIDPFTLPPEWLEDNAELETSHYELDSEQWEDPLEIIKAYKHADPSGQIPSGAVSDDGSFQGPADVVEAMEAFTDYAYMILTESGLLWVVASLVSVGLIVRLFTLK